MEKEKRIDIRLIRKYDSILENCGVFGVIIYSTANVHVKQVLYNKDYSDAIDSIIGEKWPIFSAYIDISDYNKHLNSPEKKELSGGKHFLIKDALETKENIEFMDVFNISSLKDLPIMAVFAEDENSTTRRKIFQIDDKNTFRVFEDLKHIITIVTDSLDKVDFGTEGWNKVRLKLSVYKMWTTFSKGKDFVLKYIFPFL